MLDEAAQGAGAAGGERLGGQLPQPGVVGRVAVQEGPVVQLGQVGGGEPAVGGQVLVQLGGAVVGAGLRMPQCGGDIGIAGQADEGTA